MNGKEEDRLIARRKRRYLIGVITVFMLVYAAMYLLMSLLNFIGEINPYIRLALLILFFPASYFATKKICAMPFFNDIVVASKR
ncbi:MAG: hypothetical protein IKG53_02260 [Solobacterium sp.]|nr:hypothetical protein [Solobacterium sp.]